MEEYHARLRFHTESGGPISDQRIDRAGGRLATREPSMIFDAEGPMIEVTVMVVADEPVSALREGLEAVVLAFESVGERLTFRRGQVFTLDEFEVSGDR
jgi:hypothetical protein